MESVTLWANKHHHLVETSLTIMTWSNVLFYYWPHAFQTASFIINRMLTTSSTISLPTRNYFIEHLTILSLRIFGCNCYPHLRPYQTHMFDFWSSQCVFLGYSALYKGYQSLHVPSSRIYISCNAVFDRIQRIYHMFWDCQEWHIYNQGRPLCLHIL